MIEQYAKVRMTTDAFRGEGAGVGAVGYVIECHPDGRYEVEVSSSDGVTIAQLVAWEEELQVVDGLV